MEEAAYPADFAITPPFTVLSKRSTEFRRRSIGKLYFNA